MATMLSHAPTPASGRKSPRLTGDNFGVALDDEALEYIAKEAEHGRRVGAGSPTPASVKDNVAHEQ